MTFPECHLPKWVNHNGVCEHPDHDPPTNVEPGNVEKMTDEEFLDWIHGRQPETGPDQGAG